MKKMFLVVVIVLLPALVAGVSGAENLAGKLQGIVSLSATMAESHSPCNHGSFDPNSFPGLFRIRYFIN